MSTTFRREEVDVRSEDPQLYRLQSVELSDLYVAERIEVYARLDFKNEALKQTEEWWRANLSEDWDVHFTLEKVED